MTTSNANTSCKQPQVGVESWRTNHSEIACFLEAALAEGVAIAREMFARVKAVVQGVQVSAPFGKVDVALEVFKA